MDDNITMRLAVTFFDPDRSSKREDRVKKVAVVQEPGACVPTMTGVLYFGVEVLVLTSLRTGEL